MGEAPSRPGARRRVASIATNTPSSAAVFAAAPEPAPAARSAPPGSPSSATIARRHSPVTPASTRGASAACAPASPVRRTTGSRKG
jgi:hypothetical protein